MRSAILGGLFACILGAGAQAAVLDFESLPGGGTPTRLTTGALPDHTPYLVGDLYASVGVTFSSEGDTDPEKGPIFGTMTGSTGSNTVVQDYKRDTTASFNIRADFSEVIKALTVDVFSATSRTVTMSVYDALGTLLGDVTSGALTFGTGEEVSISGVGLISYVIWESSSPLSASVGIDNLSYRPAVVPLPAGGLLLLSGLVGVGLMRRRAA